MLGSSKTAGRAERQRWRCSGRAPADGAISRGSDRGPHLCHLLIAGSHSFIHGGTGIAGSLHGVNITRFARRCAGAAMKADAYCCKQETALRCGSSGAALGCSSMH
jgi:hypothetical protein